MAWLPLQKQPGTINIAILPWNGLQLNVVPMQTSSQNLASYPVHMTCIIFCNCKWRLEIHASTYASRQVFFLPFHPNSAKWINFVMLWTMSASNFHGDINNKLASLPMGLWTFTLQIQLRLFPWWYQYRSETTVMSTFFVGSVLASLFYRNNSFPFLSPK